MLNEIKSMKAQLKEQEDRQKERDALFVEVLEGLQNDIRILKEQQTAAALPEPEPTPVDPQPEKKGFFSRWFK
jgi:hypothetical protein